MLRVRREHEHHRVSYAELFFDLVFVFAVTQLSHGLIENFTPAGAAQTAFLTLAIWWVWIYTTWAFNWLNPEKLPVRLALLVLMLPGVIMSASIPHAFESTGLGFGVSYAAIQLARTGFVVWAARSHPRIYLNFLRIFVWLAAAAVLWVAGGLVHGPARVVAWAIALGLEFVSPWLGFWAPGLGRSTTVDWDVEGGHMAERCALFVIIALGESLLVTGATFANLPWTAAIAAALIVSIGASGAMWWLYFDTSAEVGSRVISHSRDPGRIARLVYTYIHLFLVAGIILAAVGDEFVLAHPGGHTEAGTMAVVTGGPAFFLLGTWLFKWAIVGRMPVSPLVGLAALAAIAVASAGLAPLAVMTAATLVLVASAVWEGWVRATNPARES
jgi:low temperature requirement protein LtrA